MADASRYSPAGQRPFAVRVLIFLTIVVPLGGVLSAPLLVWGWGFFWTDLVLLVGMYVLTALGITVGYHRLFVHRSFDTYRWVKFLFAALGSMAVQGPLFYWAGMHRRHHQFSDTRLDPHTPHHHGEGVRGVWRGIWHSHLGWLFEAKPPDLPRYIKDLTASRSLRVANALFPLWVALGLLIPALLGGWITQSWRGMATGLVWGGLIRVFLLHHVTWSVNSACHLWGAQPYKSQDESRNNWVFGILALGEGWHNTHHAFPTSARHGIRWWQIDASYWVIRGLAFLGLAWDVSLPTAAAISKELRPADHEHGRPSPSV